MPNHVYYCSSCSSKAASSNCLRCGRYIPSNVGAVPIPAEVCSGCAARQACPLCGKAASAATIPAIVCSACKNLKGCPRCNDLLSVADMMKLRKGFLKDPPKKP